MLIGNYIKQIKSFALLFVFDVPQRYIRRKYNIILRYNIILAQ